MIHTVIEGDLDRYCGIWQEVIYRNDYETSSRIYSQILLVYWNMSFILKVFWNLSIFISIWIFRLFEWNNIGFPGPNLTNILSYFITSLIYSSLQWPWFIFSDIYFVQWIFWFLWIINLIYSCSCSILFWVPYHESVLLEGVQAHSSL